jgi:hypothetical protein
MGVYAFDEDTRSWRREFDENDYVSHISVIDGRLLALHFDTGVISLWEDGRWQSRFPSVLTTPNLF